MELMREQAMDFFAALQLADTRLNWDAALCNCVCTHVGARLGFILSERVAWMRSSLPVAESRSRETRNVTPAPKSTTFRIGIFV